MQAHPRLFRRLCTVVGLALALPLVACGDGNAPFQVRESVEQLHVTHATPGEMLQVVDGKGMVVATAAADTQGSLVFRKLAPGDGYLVRDASTPSVVSRHLKVMSVEGSLPASDFYARQVLQPGFNYIRMRDGTTLSAYVTLPGPVAAGPYPTVVDYSGYDPSKPGEPVDGGKFSYLCDQMPALCDAPNDPAGLLSALLGYATVSVNMRGTGCSGGAYDYFEALQLLDGYDVIETVAAQPWVLGNRVGMVGLSYPGITQLFIGSTAPPHLAAITPLSVIGNTATTLVPGGIFNDGFALDWITHVLDRADPYGQGWEKARVDGGDAVCKENQLLHSQKVNNIDEARTTQYYDPAVVDPLNPTLKVPSVKVPVFLAGAWQDEQTGPFFITLLDQFKQAPVRRFTVYNGVHPDGFQPEVLVEWFTFLELYVAQRVPKTPPLFRTLAPTVFDTVYHSLETLPPDRFATQPSWDAARMAYEAEPELRVLFESGMGGKDKGAPGSTFQKTFQQWPPEGQSAERLFLHADATLGPMMPTEAKAASTFQLDAAAGERGILKPGGDVWDKLPAYDWQAPQPGKAVVMETAPLTADEVMLGTASADLWLSSTADDADLQVTVSEVRPDGAEMYVQSGWLRASVRALDSAASTELWPVPTYRKETAAPLVPGAWVLARVPIAPFAHVFRQGSKIRIIVDTPGGSRAAWRFANKQFPTPPTHAIGHDAEHPSSIALPLLGGVTAPSKLPECPSLRGQPCRVYAPYVNAPQQ